VWEVVEISGTTYLPCQRVYSDVSGKKCWSGSKGTMSAADVLELYNEFFEGRCSARVVKPRDYGTVGTTLGGYVSFDDILSDFNKNTMEDSENIISYALYKPKDGSNPKLFFNIWNLSYGGEIAILDVVDNEIVYKFFLTESWSDTCTVYDEGFVGCSHGMSMLESDEYYDLEGTSQAFFGTFDYEHFNGDAQSDIESWTQELQSEGVKKIAFRCAPYDSDEYKAFDNDEEEYVKTHFGNAIDWYDSMAELIRNN
jgi:hypothetical protein